MSTVQDELYNKIKDRISKLYLSSLYDEDDNPEIYEDEHWEDLRWSIKADDVAWGASKVVFWFDDIKDYVIKVPLQGRYEDYNEDYQDFCNAYPSPAFGDKYYYASWDYCGAEAHIYSFIKENYPNLAQFFAATFLIGENDHGVPIYAAENIKGGKGTSAHWKDASDASENKACLTIDTYGSCGGLSPHILALMYDQYDENDVDDLMNFILEYHIDDLHSGNIGFNQEGKVVIMDYSGFDS